MTEQVQGTLLVEAVPASGVASGELFWQGWTAPGDSKGAVVLVHGVHEHGGRYAHVGERLANSGYPMYAVDHLGHGRSPGVRGNIDRMASVVAGVHALARQTAERHPGVPLFLYGHSMGGLIALEYLVADPVELRGAIVSAPAVDLSAASPMQIRASAMLSRWLPNLGVLALEAAAVSRDPEVVRDYETDPLNYRGKVRARTGAEILNAVLTLPERLKQLKLPLLLIHGSEDRLVPRAATDLVADSAGSDDITVKIYQGFYHESHNEPEKEQVLDDIVGWLDRHS